MCAYLPHSLKKLGPCWIEDANFFPLPSSLEVMDHISSSSIIPSFPPQLQVLKLSTYPSEKQCVTPGFIPSFLHELTLGWQFNQRLSPGLLPEGMTILNLGGSLGSLFNHSLRVNVLPPRLRILILSQKFNFSIVVGALPYGLEPLCFPSRSEFNKPILPGVLPETLPELVLSEDFTQPLTAGVLPDSLRSLTLPMRKVAYTHWNTVYLPALTSLAIYPRTEQILLRWIEMSPVLAASLKEIRSEEPLFQNTLQLDSLRQHSPDVSIIDISLRAKLLLSQSE